MLTRLIYVLLACWFALTAVSCATPPQITETAVPPTTTPLPATATTAPKPEPTATPTLTADQLRDQRATAVLIIFPGYDPAHHDALLPLARALWGDEDVIDPADVTIVVGETAVQITSDAAYPSGTLFVWNADSHPQPLILTGQENSTINRGEVAFGAASLNTWVRYDLDGNVVEFVDPAGNWISPLDIQTDGSFSFFTQERILADGSRENTNAVWWANGGQPVELSSPPPSANPNESLVDYLSRTSKTIQPKTIDGQEYVVIIDAAGLRTEHRYNQDTGEWEVFEISAVNLGEAVEQLRAQSVNMIHESVNLDPTETLPGFGLSATERLYTDMEQIVAVVTNEDVVRRGLMHVHNTNRTNNPDAPPGHSLYRTVNPVTGQLETTAVPHNATVNLQLTSAFDTIDTRLVPYHFGPGDNNTRFGLHYNEATNSLTVLIQYSTRESTDAGVGSQPHGLWNRVLNIFSAMTHQVDKFPTQGGNLTSITVVSEEIRGAFSNTEVPQFSNGVASINFFSANRYLQRDTNPDLADLWDELWGHQYPHDKN